MRDNITFGTVFNIMLPTLYLHSARKAPSRLIYVGDLHFRSTLSGSERWASFGNPGVDAYFRRSTPHERSETGRFILWPDEQKVPRNIAGKTDDFGVEIFPIKGKPVLYEGLLSRLDDNRRIPPSYKVELTFAGTPIVTLTLGFLRPFFEEGGVQNPYPATSHYTR